MYCATSMEHPGFAFGQQLVVLTSNKRKSSADCHVTFVSRFASVRRFDVLHDCGGRVTSSRYKKYNKQASATVRCLTEQWDQ